MAYNLTFDELSKVPEELKDAVQEKDGVFVVKVEPASKIAEFRENNIKISKERDALNGTLSQALKLLGVGSPDELSAAEENLGKLRDIARKVEDGELVQNTSLEQALEKRTTEMRSTLQAQIAEKAKEMEAWQKRASAFESKLKNTLIDRAISQAALDKEIGAYPSALPDIMSRARELFTIDDNDKIVPKRNGEIVYGADGTSPMSVKEYLQSLRNDAPHLFQGAQGGGATGNSKTVKLSRAELAKMTPQQIMAVANQTG